MKQIFTVLLCLALMSQQFAGESKRSLQKAFESITDYDVGGFRVNLQAKKFMNLAIRMCLCE